MAQQRQPVRYFALGGGRRLLPGEKDRIRDRLRSCGGGDGAPLAGGAGGAGGNCSAADGVGQLPRLVPYLDGSLARLLSGAAAVALDGVGSARPCRRDRMVRDGRMEWRDA